MNRIIQTISYSAAYEGSVKHCLINYTLILLCILPHIISDNKIEAGKNRWPWVFLTAVIVQVVLWFSAGAAGVSVIWSLMSGFNLVGLLRSKNHLMTTTGRLFIISLLMALSAVTYYAVAFPFITTVAHLTGAVAGHGFLFSFS